MVALCCLNALVSQQIASSFLTPAISRVIRRLGAQVIEPEVLDALGERRCLLGLCQTVIAGPEQPEASRIG